MKMMSQILHGYCLIRSLLTCSYVTCMHRHLIHNQTVSFCIAPYSLHDLYPIEYLIKVPIQENPESRRAPIRQDNIKPLQKDDAKKKKTDRVSAYYYDQTNPPSTAHSNKQGGIMVNLQLE